MAQRIIEQRATTIGLGVERAEFPDGEGDVVDDDELIGASDPEASVPPAPRRSVPRISQRLPRPSIGAGGAASEGEILVGRYRVERVVSRTANELVVEASHLDLGQRVLLRHLSALASTSPEAVARFQRGARKARELRSEHAERVVDFGRLGSGAPYRAVELPHGPSLAEILRVRGALPISEAIDIVLTACEPVAEAHAAGMVHRCLSTQNIYVERRSDGTPLVRVLDFGVTDPLEPDWVNGDDLPVPGATAAAETLRYASPEQIRNPSAVDARADVWALGAILYELIAGAPLFQSESSLTLLAMIAADAPTPLGLLRNDVPPELEQLVLGCLEKEPEARPRSVVEVVLALAPFASSEAQQAAARVARIVMRTTRPPPLPSHLPPPMHSRAGALVRTQPPAPFRSQEPPLSLQSRDPRGFGMLFAGAGIGLGASLIAVLVARPPQPVAAAAPVAAPVAAATLPAATAVQAVASLSAAPPVAATIAATPVGAAAPAATATAAPPAPAVQPVARPVARAAKPRSAPRAERAEAGDNVTASADALFGGLD